MSDENPLSPALAALDAHEDVRLAYEGRPQARENENPPANYATSFAAVPLRILEAVDDPKFAVAHLKIVPLATESANRALAAIAAGEDFCPGNHTWFYAINGLKGLLRYCAKPVGSDCPSVASMLADGVNVDSICAQTGLAFAQIRAEAATPGSGNIPDSPAKYPAVIKELASQANENLAFLAVVPDLRLACRLLREAGIS